MRMCVLPPPYASFTDMSSFSRNIYLFAYQQFPDLFHTGSRPANTKEGRVSCEKGREGGLFLLKQTAASISMKLSL